MRRPVAALFAAVALTGAADARAASAPLQSGIWISRAELRRAPEDGAAWRHLVSVARAPLGRASLANQDSVHDVHVLANALVFARTGEARFGRRAAGGIADAIGTEAGGRTLALARGLVSYVVAADLIDLRHLRPALDRRFRGWLAHVRVERLAPAGYPTLVATDEQRPNNWGMHAGASRIAADVYLGDTGDLARAAAVFKGWLGDRSAWHAFRFGEPSWQADPRRPVGVDPRGSRRDGHLIDGALPDDLRRGCSFRWPPCPTRYPWEALQGAVAQAEMLSRQGYDAWNWEHQAIRRAARFLLRLDRDAPGQGWWAPGGNAWIPWLLNARYGTHFPTRTGAPPGKGLGFTDWTASGPLGCRRRACTAPRGPRRTVAQAASAHDGDVAAPAAATAGGLALAALGVLFVRRRARRSRRR